MIAVESESAAACCDPPPTIDWQIDAGHRVLINTGEALQQAADFNDWESLLAE